MKAMILKIHPKHSEKALNVRGQVLEESSERETYMKTSDKDSRVLGEASEQKTCPEITSDKESKVLEEASEQKMYP